MFQKILDSVKNYLKKDEKQNKPKDHNNQEEPYNKEWNDLVDKYSSQEGIENAYKKFEFPQDYNGKVDIDILKCEILGLPYKTIKEGEVEMARNFADDDSVHWLFGVYAPLPEKKLKDFQIYRTTLKANSSIIKEATNKYNSKWLCLPFQ